MNAFRLKGARAQGLSEVWFFPYLWIGSESNVGSDLRAG